MSRWASTPQLEGGGGLMPLRRAGSGAISFNRAPL